VSRETELTMFAAPEYNDRQSLLEVAKPSKRLGLLRLIDNNREKLQLKVGYDALLFASNERLCRNFNGFCDRLFSVGSVWRRERNGRIDKQWQKP
jgi:hypothetical protein